jgi:hypothetical protein
MKSVILHADGRRTDLAGAVDPATYTELENLHCPRRNPVLWCGGCGGSIYIRHGSTRKDELFGAHHDRGDCAETLIIRKSLLSDEHKYQAEYHAVAAQEAGHTADLEVTTTGHTRVDVVIDGSIGIEVQRSQLTKVAAVDRTARSVAAGLASVTWFTDRTTSPQWTGHVPGYRTNTPAAEWKRLLPPRTATAAGLRIVEAVRCGTRSLCVHPRPCTRFIPDLNAWTGLYVDDVVEGLAAGTIRPVRYGRYVWLLSTASIGLYEELTGTRLTYEAGQPRGRQLPPTLRQECYRLLPMQPPESAPPTVRDWFERETQRVQRAREEAEAREQREQERRERELREDREHWAREREARAEARERTWREAQQREAEVRERMWAMARKRRDERIRAEREADARNRSAAPARQPTGRLHLSLDDEPNWCRFGAGSLYCIRPDCHNPNHRAAPSAHQGDGNS